MDKIKFTTQNCTQDSNGKQNKGPRVDSYLADNLDASRESIQRLIGRGGVKIDGKPVQKASRRLVCGDEIQFDREALKREASPSVKDYDVKPQDVDFGVVYEDDKMVVVNKPQGIVVHPGCKNREGTLLNGLVRYFQEKGEKRLPKLVHRIDKATSGLLIVAKGERNQYKLSRQFEERKVKKIYRAVVHGVFHPPELRSKTKQKYGLRFVEKEESGVEWLEFGCFLARAKKDRRRMGVVEESSEQGRWALSDYCFVGECSCKCSQVEVLIKTGRTHQIRAQLKYLGYPVLGDVLYSSASEQDKTRGYFKKFGVEQRMMLHAHYLEISIFGGEKKRFEAPLPDEFTKLCSNS